MYLYNFTKNNLLFLSDKDIPTKEAIGSYFHYVVTRLENKPYHQVYIRFDGNMTIEGSDSYPQKDSINIRYDLKVTPYKNITEYYEYTDKFILTYRKYIFFKEDVNKYNDLLSFHILYSMTYHANNVYILPTISSILNHHPSEFSTNIHPYTFNKNKSIIRSFGKDEALKTCKLITKHIGLQIILKRRYNLIFQDKEPIDESSEPQMYHQDYKISQYLEHFFEIYDNNMKDARRYFILMFAEDLKNNPQVIASSYFVKNDNLDSLICKYNKKDPTRCDIPQHVKDYIGNKHLYSLERETIIRLDKQGLLDDFIKDIRQSSISIVNNYNPQVIETLYNIFSIQKLNLKNKLKSYMSKRWNYEILCDVFEGLDMRSIKELASLYNIDANLTRIQICTELSKILDRKKEEYKRAVSNCTNSNDPISGNDVENIDPRESITLEQDGKQFCFEIEGLHEYIIKDKSNPYTRQPFSDEQIETIQKEYSKFRKLKGSKFDADTYKYETSLHALTVKLVNFLPYTSGVEKFTKANLEKIINFVDILNYIGVDIKVDLYNPQTSLETKKRTILEQLIKYIVKKSYWSVKIAWNKVFMNNREVFSPVDDNKLIKAITTENFENLSKYIREGVDVNEVHPILGEPLYLAIKGGSLSVIKHLIDAGAIIKYNYPEKVYVNTDIKDYLIHKDILSESDFIETNRGYFF